MPTVAPGVDPTMMRAPAAPVVPAPSVVPNVMRSTNVATVAMGASGQNDANESLAASASAAPQRRIGGFLIALLLFDAALATAGGLMMRSALARTAALSTQSTVPAPVVSDPVVTPTVTGAGSGSSSVAVTPRKNAPIVVPEPAIGSGAAAAGAAAATVVPDAAGSGSAAPVGKPDPKISQNKTSEKAKGSAAGPVDPYGTTPTPIPTLNPDVGPTPTPTDPIPPPLDGDQTAQEESLADQVRRQEVVSRSRLARCYSTAAKASDVPLKGAVTVSFQISPQGRVLNANAVDNSTDSMSLGRCVVAEVSKWTFVSDAGAPQDFVRVFKFEGQ